MGESRFRTLGAPVSAQIEVKRSRFLCDLVPLRGDVFAAGSGPALPDAAVGLAAADGPAPDAEAQARAVVDATRKVHWDARHHCSAFVLGPQGALRRSSDDGEPSGTAGAPMLEMLAGAGVTDVVAVVTRWFGGTLLGAGGLVRAYGDAVRAALEEAHTVTYARRLLLDAAVDLAGAGRVENGLRAAGFDVEDVDYATQAAQSLAVVRLAVPEARRARAAGEFAEMIGAPVELLPRGHTWMVEHPPS